MRGLLLVVRVFGVMLALVGMVIYTRADKAYHGRWIFWGLDDGVFQLHMALPDGSQTQLVYAEENIAEEAVLERASNPTQRLWYRFHHEDNTDEIVELDFAGNVHSRHWMNVEGNAFAWHVSSPTKPDERYTYLYGVDEEEDSITGDERQILYVYHFDTGASVVAAEVTGDYLRSSRNRFVGGAQLFVYTLQVVDGISIAKFYSIDLAQDWDNLTPITDETPPLCQIETPELEEGVDKAWYLLDTLGPTTIELYSRTLVTGSDTVTTIYRTFDLLTCELMPYPNLADGVEIQHTTDDFILYEQDGGMWRYDMADYTHTYLRPYPVYDGYTTWYTDDDRLYLLYEDEVTRQVVAAGTESATDRVLFTWDDDIEVSYMRTNGPDDPYIYIDASDLDRKRQYWRVHRDTGAASMVHSQPANDRITYQYTMYATPYLYWFTRNPRYVPMQHGILNRHTSEVQYLPLQGDLEARYTAPIDRSHHVQWLMASSISMIALSIGLHWLVIRQDAM